MMEFFPVEPYPGLEILCSSSSPEDPAALGWEIKNFQRKKTSITSMLLKPDKIPLFLGILVVFLALIITSIK
jgi:hypothetical protein